ncbi:MAG: hypothetical protein H6742_15755 [Alphaproteobacteria bacterium]|nr:hypothetical protein [Alphaproteobacteria bacterium]
MSRSLRTRDRIIQVGAGVALLAALELLARAFVPLPDQDRYLFFRLHGADGFVALQQGMDPVAFLGRTHALLEDDGRRLWRLRPDLDLDATSLSIGAPRSWTVHTNHEGWRGPLTTDVPPAQPPVVALGDSCTFGWGVDDDEPYPAVLDGLLPDRVVLNRGVPGWSSVQGASLAEELGGSLRPAALIIAFGANDAHQVGKSDGAWLSQRASTVGQLRHAVAKLRLVALARHQLYPVWARAQGLAWQAGTTEPRVDPHDFRIALESMMDRAPRTVLVDVCANDAYRQVMQAAADAHPTTSIIHYDDVHGETIDGCHPTRPGHHALAGALARALEPDL